MNYYQVLGIPEKASDKDIKRAYKKLVKKYHPDIFHGDKEFAENKIKEINEAYETLSDPMLKSEYDALLYGSNDDDNSNGPSHRTTQAEDNYNNNLRYRDNDFYGSDSYRHYSSRYYGRSRPSQEYEEYKRSQAAKSKGSDFLDSLSKPKILLLIGIVSVIMIVVLIFLLGILKDLTTPTNTVDLNNDYPENGVLIIERGLPYSLVVKYYGEPDNIEHINSGFYAYYGDSYILFDKNDTIADWVNYGDFVTSYMRGKQEEDYQHIYDELQNLMYFE